MTKQALNTPYLVFLGDAEDFLMAKVAKGVAYWRPNHCVAQLRIEGCSVDLGLPDMSIRQAAAAGAKSLLLGLAPVGGTLPETWIPLLIEALEAGLDIASGLHVQLNQIPQLAEAAMRTNQRLIDVRVPSQQLDCGTGEPRPGKRLLTVGTDCCVGKMFSALAIHAEMIRRGIAASFRATGQTGILIEGAGVPVDAVVSDFIAGAVEQLCPANDPQHWDVIEGQGSLFHPSYAGVSLGLLHGAQADALVLCHELGRKELDNMPVNFPVPDLEQTIALNLQLGRLTNPDIRLVGIAVNSSKFSETAASAEMARVQKQFGVPVVDPVRTGVSPIVDLLEDL